MGGGGAMRAAFKAAGIGIQRATFRGLPDQFTSWTSIRPPPSSHSSASIAWEIEDWEIAGYEAVEEKPRLVFGPPPSIEESKEAASQLKDALDMLYFSPSKPAASFHLVSAIESDAESEHLHGNTITYDVDEGSDVLSAPSHAMQAFKLFKENEAARVVVAAIASDPNVWNAVLENEALKKFLQSEKGTEVDEAESVNSSADSRETADSVNVVDLFADFAENVKEVIAGWVKNMSASFQELFGDSDNKPSTGLGIWSPSSNTVRGSLFALASMVIMVVVLKRG